jgi:hypothetical protein
MVIDVIHVYWKDALLVQRVTIDPQVAKDDVEKVTAAAWESIMIS